MTSRINTVVRARALEILEQELHGTHTRAELVRALESAWQLAQVPRQEWPAGYPQLVLDLAVAMRRVCGALSCDITKTYVLVKGVLLDQQRAAARG